MPRYDRVALVLEGGGMRASYSAGLVAALLEAEVRFPFVAAVSAGATLASAVLSDDRPRLRAAFVDMAEDPEFGGWRFFARGEGYFNAHYIYEETGYPGGTLPFCYARFLANDMEMAIGAFARDSGKMHWWQRKDVHSLRDMMRIVRASSSLPLVMPPTWIDGVCYLDGGLGESIPLSPALAAGYDRFFIVRTRERGYRKEPPRAPTLLRTFWHRHPLAAEAMLTRPARYNAQLEEIAALEAAGQAFVLAPERMPLSRTELSPAAVAAAYDAGLAQGRRQRSEWQAFLEGTSKGKEG